MSGLGSVNQSVGIAYLLVKSTFKSRHCRIEGGLGGAEEKGGRADGWWNQPAPARSYSSGGDPLVDSQVCRAAATDSAWPGGVAVYWIHVTRTQPTQKPLRGAWQR
ncbi:hypothetical protein A2264_01865 [candidate division WWE3 bacterium RIFOXYA2_FULL_46_9]|uniref:Uncharacterized protein n=1 Tax=candidate division WWE3 bacterium RIFOXYA2_FULL_46_9 TaxID=1802636 RepID=A0A1F4W0X9_UNCKA|nr:MAG: hypothetical protein A2264_01865 [candidate division WWE3 bacterium RIFOXYA2_FULL_46_9]